jgi:hypothetical protein
LLSASIREVTMDASDKFFHSALCKLLVEILDGPPGNEAYILNPGDPGLLAQLASIDARAASSRPMPGKTTIASHVDHVLYGFTLLNRWAAGEENPWADADWEASWRRTTVNEDEWRSLREKFRGEAKKWQVHVAARIAWNDIMAAGAISSVAHTVYHLGAIRQILAALDKPS